MYKLALAVILAAANQKSTACNNDRDGISGSDLPKMRTGFTISHTSAIDQAIERAKERYEIAVKLKITPSIRNSVPVELFILSGFTAEEQSNQDMAGCYIRLGSSIRSTAVTPQQRRLSATAFLNSGNLYVLDSINAEDVNLRVDLLISAAKCYYWAFCNENEHPRKETIKGIANKYYERASTDVLLISDNEQRRVFTEVIERDKRKLA